MERGEAKVLIVNDNDMNCDISKNTIDFMSIANIGFSKLVVDKYDIIVYAGAKGTKVLKSKYFKTGKIV